MLCVCVGDVMDVVFSVCIVRRGAVGAFVWGVGVFRHADVVSCVHPVAVLHDLQFVNAGRGCNRRPYRRGILQSRFHNCFIGSHECLQLFPVSAFMISRGFCACTQMLWMCVLYVSFGSKV